MEMELNLSNHAQKKSSRLGFSSISIEIIKQFGKRRNCSGGTEELFFGNKEARRAAREFKVLIQILDKVKGGSLVMAGGEVLTLNKN